MYVRVNGIDDKRLTNDAVAEALRRIEGALKSLPENGRIYQYVRVSKGFEIPRRKDYLNPQIESAIGERLAFLERTADFRRIELFWTFTIEPEASGFDFRGCSAGLVDGGNSLFQIDTGFQCAEHFIA